MKNGKRPRIALVDDEADFLELMRLHLRQDYEVTGYSSGDALLRDIDRLEPDLLILDIHMPGMDGFEVCRRVRALPKFLFLPILFLTASKEEGDLLTNADSAANSYLNKPIGGAALQAEVRQVLAFHNIPVGSAKTSRV